MSEYIDLDEENTRLVMLNALKALKYFYSFKELETLLEIPSQVLWRYLSFRAVPEKETALKIVEKVKEKRLLQRIVEELQARSSNEEDLYNTNPGVLLLAYLKLAGEKWASDATVVLTKQDPASVAMSTILALNFRARLCVASSRVRGRSYIHQVYTSPDGNLGVLAISRNCIHKKDRILVAMYECEQEECKAVAELALRSQGSLGGVFVFRGRREELANYLEKGLGLKVPLETFIEL